MRTVDPVWCLGCLVAAGVMVLAAMAAILEGVLVILERLGVCFFGEGREWD